MLHSSKERASLKGIDTFTISLLDETLLGRLPCKAATPGENLSNASRAAG
jgi:hypothetical protein